ncbi:fungal-specific transcription factor domain-containing protein [Desarmillaria ectypa]|nr:fungal-specific transcription factor domain-containing protein [Desarmillaria ectypa]
MAPQPRKDNNSGQRVQDKESKRSQGRLSCAECRYVLKLKCDKTVPCSSCKRRGCSAICPNGSLITGQGTRFVLADTEKLHQKIAHMSDRIRQLEDALMILQSTVTTEPHPLLDRDLLKIKSSIELHAAIQESENNAMQAEEADDSQYIDAFGTLAIRDDGAATFYGRSAGQEVINEAKESSASPETRYSTTAWTSDLAPPVTQPSTSFPFSTVPSGISLDYLVENHVPEWNEGYRLCNLYLETAPWFFGAVHRRQLFEELIPLWYQDGAKRPINSTPPSATSAPVTKSGAHDLALLFIIFCFGALTDMNLPAAPDNPVCEQYYDLTKAALSIEPLLERPPSVATVQTLSLMAIYEGLKSGENSIESTWTLMGMSTKLAQSVHRDCARWKLPPAEVQKRRALFWELFITDCWQSLATGRLATFSLPFVDCELPLDADQTMAADGTIQPSFPYWKARFGAECVAAVVQGSLTSRAPKYSIILDLDRKVRDMELPKYAQGPPPEGAGLSETMSHFMPTNYRELTLLYIHRCFFVHAINSSPSDPIKSQYAPSFLAGYRSACDLLASVKQQFTRFPAQIARFWVLWTHAFSSTVMISSVVIHGPTCKVAPAALLELKAACDLFDTAARYGGRAVKFLPIVKRLQGKAQKIYFDMRNGIAPTVGQDIFRPSTENEDDEMHIFSGKTRTLTTKHSSRPNPQSRTSQSDSRASSDSPPQTNNPSFTGVHPNLVHELNGFEGHIRAQIESAYQQGNEPTYYQPPPVPPPSQQQYAQPTPSGQYQQHSLRRSRSMHYEHHHEVETTLQQPDPVAQSQVQQYSAVAHQTYQTAAEYGQHTAPPPPPPQHQHQQDVYDYSKQTVYHHNQQQQSMEPESVSPSTSYSQQQYPSPETATTTTAQQQYWTDQAMDTTADYSQQHSHYGMHQYQQHYTPEGAMRGIAADDQSLQQTWQSYMYNVSLTILLCFLRMVVAHY